MIFQMLLVGAATLGVGYYRATMDYRAIKPYMEKWDKLMKSMGIKNKIDETFTPLKINVMDNGVTYVINIPPGLKIDKLESIRDEINTYFKGVTTIKRVKFASHCIVKIITKDISDFKFAPVKCKEYEVYIGKTLDLENYKVDLTKAAAHLLIAAPSGKGKSFLIASILTNLIYNSSDKIEIYLLQIMKGDVGNFEKCKPVKFTAYTLAEVAWGLEKIVDIIVNRDKMFRALGINNLKNYNRHYPNSKIKRVYAVIEEISFFMTNDSDNDQVKEVKSRCLEAIKTIARAGRSSGVHAVIITQRGTVENLPSLLKSMCIRICLGQISAIDSRNIIESDDAIYLEDKECYVYGDIPGISNIRVPTIDEDFKILQKYVPEIKTPIILNNKKDNKDSAENELKENSNEVNKPILIEKKEVKEEIKTKDSFSFKGPSFKIIDFESQDESNKVDKKIMRRKGVYIEEE